MNGWFAVLVIGMAEILTPAVLVFLVPRRWPNYLVIGLIALVSFKPFYRSMTGDMSRVLPNFIWSDGADDKDQIIFVSAVSTIALPLTFGLVAFLSARSIAVWWKGRGQG